MLSPSQCWALEWFGAKLAEESSKVVVRLDELRTVVERGDPSAELLAAIDAMEEQVNIVDGMIPDSTKET